MHLWRILINIVVVVSLVPALPVLGGYQYEIMLQVDNEFYLYVDGTEVLRGNQWNQIYTWRSGTKPDTLAIYAQNNVSNILMEDVET